jgi:L-lactate dehydrogenase complex protein LldE
MRVSLFVTCLNDTLFPRTGIAVVRLMERLGHEVDFPSAQTCCGQMHGNSGYWAEALALLRRNVEVLEGPDPVLVPSTSCTAMIRGQYRDIARTSGDLRLIDRVEDLAQRVFDLSEFLVDVLGIEDVGAYYPHRVAYHSSCNALRALKLGDRPYRLLSHVRGLELLDLPHAAECCGFGGTFAVKNADTSTAMLSDKLGHLLASGAEICTAGDNSCLMHIGGGLSRQRAGVKVVHLAEILACAQSEPA